MPKSHARPAAVAKQKLKDRAKQVFNYLLKNVLPQHIKNNPITSSDLIHTEDELLAWGHALPLLVTWEKVVGDVTTPEVSINEWALNEFLLQHMTWNDEIFNAVRDQVKYYLWIHILGDEAAAYQVQKTLPFPPLV